MKYQEFWLGVSGAVLNPKPWTQTPAFEVAPEGGGGFSCSGWIRCTSNPVIVTGRDYKDYIGVLLYSRYSTVAGWEVQLMDRVLQKVSGLCMDKVSTYSRLYTKSFHGSCPVSFMVLLLPPSIFQLRYLRIKSPNQG